jgi:hypothetical protein
MRDRWLVTVDLPPTDPQRVLAPVIARLVGIVEGIATRDATYGLELKGGKRFGAATGGPRTSPG